jgi:hypothetical protein
MRRFLSATALILSLTAALHAGEPGHGEKVAVTTLPDAVKATVTKEAPDATDVMKMEKDGVVTYKVKAKDAEGHPQFVTIGADGAVISKHGAKDKK